MLSSQILIKQDIASSEASNLFLVNLFGIVLVTALGRFLVAELNIINKKQQELKIEQLQKLDKIKDEFVFIIAHELRSPITAIRGYLELINTDPKNKVEDNLSSLLNKSFSTANKLASIVSMLLEVARLETGKISFYFQKIDIRNSIDFVVSSLKKEIKEKEIQMTINVPKENLILIDKERLEEILMVLLENAVQFTPEYGTILISSQTSEKHVILAIADSGVGIPQNMKDTMFEKIYTENNNSGEIVVKGYGVGLYVAKQLLLKMNGDIKLESLVGKGTTFTLTLPKYWAFGK
jgi:two-component system phosphate regulon sensor histidine kinase PhoR